MLAENANYRVQEQDSQDDWISVENSDFVESFRAIHLAQATGEKDQRPTRVINSRGAVVWPQHPADNPVTPVEVS